MLLPRVLAHTPLHASSNPVPIPTSIFFPPLPTFTHQLSSKNEGGIRMVSPFKDWDFNLRHSDP